MKSFKVLLLAMVLIGALQVCHAELVPAIGRDPAEVEWVSNLGRAGWTFYATAPIVVTAVGFYDHENDGLFEDQQIAIWKDTSGQTTWPFMNPFTAVVVASNTIPRGTETTLLGSYRIVTFDVPLTLESGGYEIACVEPAGPDLGKFMNANDPISLRVDPRILLGAPATGTDSPPSEYVAAYGANVGTMLFLEVPEPRASLLVLVGAAIALIRRRRPDTKTQRLKVHQLILWIPLCGLARPGFCQGDIVPAIGRDPADLTQSLGVRNSGWTFYADVPVLVKAIGFYDHLADGLFDDQQITIWKDTSGQTTFPFINPFTAELAFTASIPKGTAATLIGSYRVMMLETDLTLEPGGYEIACHSATGGDPGKYLNGNDPISPGVDPRISLGAPAIGEGSPPSEYIAAYGAHLGPMFFIEVPEPSIASLLLLAGMLGLARRRRL